MRSALNVSPFCRMIGEALTSAPAVMSLAKARRVYADDQLFAFPAIRLAGFAFFLHLPVVWSVFRLTVSVVGFAFSRFAIEEKELGLNSVAKALRGSCMLISLSVAVCVSVCWFRVSHSHT